MAGATVKAKTAATAGAGKMTERSNGLALRSLSVILWVLGDPHEPRLRLIECEDGHVRLEGDPDGPPCPPRILRTLAELGYEVTWGPDALPEPRTGPLASSGGEAGPQDPAGTAIRWGAFGVVRPTARWPTPADPE